MSHYHDSNDLKLLGEMKRWRPWSSGDASRWTMSWDVSHGARALKFFDQAREGRR